MVENQLHKVSLKVFKSPNGSLSPASAVGFYLTDEQKKMFSLSCQSSHKYVFGLESKDIYSKVHRATVNIGCADASV